MYVRGGGGPRTPPLSSTFIAKPYIHVFSLYKKEMGKRRKKKIYIKNIVELFRMYVFNYKKDARNVMYSSFYRTLPKSS